MPCGASSQISVFWEAAACHTTTGWSGCRAAATAAGGRWRGWQGEGGAGARVLEAVDEEEGLEVGPKAWCGKGAASLHVGLGAMPKSSRMMCSCGRPTWHHHPGLTCTRAHARVRCKDPGWRNASRGQRRRPPWHGAASPSPWDLWLSDLGNKGGEMRKKRGNKVLAHAILGQRKD